jgi:UDP-glucuronate 4-epimerase
VDNLNTYYDPALKQARLGRLEGRPGFRFQRLDLAETEPTLALFAAERPAVVIHLAAQAGVRYSLTHPHVYAHSNVVATLNVLEGCRHHGVAHLVYASSSSVYGANTRMPFKVSDSVDHPVSLYAATKKATELMAHTYSHLFRIPTTGLRFFTVYGPWGRPDMAMFLFTSAVLEGKPIDVFNHGDMSRDFTYVDDVVEGVLRIAACPPAPDSAWDPDAPNPGSSNAPYRVYNIGNNRPVKLLDMIAAVEQATGKQAEKRLLPMQPGDVVETWADVDDLVRDFGYRPDTPIEEGVRRFVEWYREYYRV